MMSLRVSVFAIGMIGIIWGTSEFSTFRQESVISNIAKRIIAGDPFRSEILLNQAVFVEQDETSVSCRPVILRSTAVVRLRLAEVSDNSGLAPEPVRKDLAAAAIRRSISCSPADPFFWLVLFALEPSALSNYLSTSYRLGPNEGWIALKRNPVAFAEFDELPEGLRDAVVHEFLRILEMGFYDEALKIFVGPAWDKKELILSRMGHVSRRHRQKLAELLAAGGYDVIVPGTTLNIPH